MWGEKSLGTEDGGVAPRLAREEGYSVQSHAMGKGERPVGDVGAKGEGTGTVYWQRSAA